MAKNIGTAIGCSYFAIVRAKTLRRYSLEKKEHYESYAAVYGVDTRTGRLIFWGLVTREAPEADHAEKLLQESAAGIASGLVKAIGAETRSGPNQPADFEVDELPEESSDAAGEFRPPLPYRRLRPEYTPAAELYGIEATIDILVEIDEKGKVLSTVISRWAGFGLDESVEKTVRAMQWRPASRAGKPFPMRVLLRYNFKKLAKD